MNAALTVQDYPLLGFTVLVTRPAGQSDYLANKITLLGGQSVLFPLLDIVAVETTPAIQLITPFHWDWFIFVSTNAVRFSYPFMQWITRCSENGTRSAAIGHATAKALKKEGVEVQLIPTDVSTSESLLASADMFHVTGQRILIVRGVGGREHLPEVLRQRGAEVMCISVYERTCPTSYDHTALDTWHRATHPVGILTSAQALTHLMTCLSTSGTEIVQRVPLVVMSARLAELARRQGWYKVAVAESTSDEGLLQTLLQLRLNNEIAYRRDCVTNPVLLGQI